MRVVDLKQRFMYGHFSICKYEESELDALIEGIEILVNLDLEDESPILALVEKKLINVFPDFSDDDVELALEKMYEEIDGIEGGHVIERKFNNVVNKEKQILLYWYRQSEALFVNYIHIQEEREKEIANQRYQDAVKGGLFDCDDITFESEEVFSKINTLIEIDGKGFALDALENFIDEQIEQLKGEL